MKKKPKRVEKKLPPLSCIEEEIPPLSTPSETMEETVVYSEGLQKTKLIIVHGFAQYQRGDSVSNPVEIEKIKSSFPRRHYHEINLDNQE